MTARSRRTTLLASGLVWLVSLAVGAGPVYVPGPWFDTNKTHDQGYGRLDNYYEDLDQNGEYTVGEPWKEHMPADTDEDRNRDVDEDWGMWKWHWGEEVYYEDENGDGHKDPGEETSPTLDADVDEDRSPDSAESWPGLWLGDGDNSCWAAAANNVRRYVGGPNEYMTWMYQTGVTSRNWTHAGWIAPVLEEVGHKPHGQWATEENVWTEGNPVPDLAELLNDGLAVGLDVWWASGGGHCFTVYGVDEDAQRLTFVCSDQDPAAGAFHTAPYQFTHDGFWQIDYYDSGTWNGDLSGINTFDAKEWTGDADTTSWHDGENWEGGLGGGVPLPNDVARIGFGTVNIGSDSDTNATCTSCIVDGAGTTLNVNSPLVSPLAVSALHAVDSGQINVAGAASVSRHIICEGSITVEGTGVVQCLGSAYIGGQDPGGLAVHGVLEVDSDIYMGYREGETGALHILSGQASVNGTECVGYRGTGTVNHFGGSHHVPGTLSLGTEATGVGTYTYTGDSLVVGHLCVGDAGEGTFSHDTGIAIAENVSVGRAGGGDGLYRLLSGSLRTTDLVVGRYGTGTFTHSNGTATVTDDLTLGEWQAGSGEYGLSAGAQLDVTGDTLVGWHGHGYFHQEGGTHTLAGKLIVGASNDGNGDYDLDDGSVDASGITVGRWDAHGTFTQSGGLATSTGDMSVGVSGASGNYTISGGDLKVKEGTIHIGGLQPGAHGEFHLDGGVVVAEEVELRPSGGGSFHATGGILRVNILTGFGDDPRFGGTLQLGQNPPDGVADYHLGLADSLTTGNHLAVGYTSRATLTQDPQSTVSVRHSLYLGEREGAEGTYIQSGDLEVSENAYIGDAGKGTMNHDHGTNTIDGTLYLGMADTGEGIYDMQASDFDAPILMAWEELIGGLGRGTFSQSSGTHAVMFDLWVGAWDGGEGTYHMHGGDLEVPTLHVGSPLGGEGTFNWHGGDLHVDTVTVHPDSTMNVDIPGHWAIDGSLNVHGGAVEMESTDLFVSHPDAAAPRRPVLTLTPAWRVDQGFPQPVEGSGELLHRRSGALCLLECLPEDHRVREHMHRNALPNSREESAKAYVDNTALQLRSRLLEAFRERSFERVELLRTFICRLAGPSNSKQSPSCATSPSRPSPNVQALRESYLQSKLPPGRLRFSCFLPSTLIAWPAPSWGAMCLRFAVLSAFFA